MRCSRRRWAPGSAGCGCGPRISCRRSSPTPCTTSSRSWSCCVAAPASPAFPPNWRRRKKKCRPIARAVCSRPRAGAWGLCVPSLALWRTQARSASDGTSPCWCLGLVSDCLSVFPLAHRQHHRLTLEEELRLQLESPVQGTMLERPVAERVLEVLELIRPTLHDSKCGLEQGDLGLVPTLRRDHFVHGGEDEGGQPAARLRLLGEFRVLSIKLFPGQRCHLFQLIVEGEDVFQQLDGLLVGFRGVHE